VGVEKTSNIKGVARVSVHALTCEMMPDNQWLEDILNTGDFPPDIAAVR
jgi:hypothetical protein